MSPKNATDGVTPGNSGIPAIHDLSAIINERRALLQSAVDAAFAPVAPIRAKYNELSQTRDEIMEKVKSLEAEMKALYDNQLAPYAHIADSAQAELKAFERKTKYVPTAIALLSLRHQRATDPIAATYLPNDDTFLQTQLPMRTDGSGKHVKATEKTMNELSVNVADAVQFIQTLTQQQQ